jgi:general stress protein 26
MHNNDTHLNFLRTKIEQTKVAFFKSEINSVLSLPPNVVQILKTDDEGNIYFFTSCAGRYATQINEPFYAYLDFHKKGNDTRMQVSGKAQIMLDEFEELNYINEEADEKNSIILIKMKMMQAEYFDRSADHSASWAKKIKSTFTNLFFPAEQHFNFS